MKKIIILTALITAGLLWIKSEKAKVNYADFACPVCGSEEVLDFGDSARGQHYSCYDCKADFYIND